MCTDQRLIAVLTVTSAMARPQVTFVGLEAGLGQSAYRRKARGR